MEIRNIAFKAKRLDNGEWVEGYYQKRFDLDGSEQHFIFWSKSYTVWECVEIDSDTICQYTGLTDKNGNNIWENDIVHIRSSGLSGYGVIKYENGNLVLVDAKRKRTYSMYGEWKIRKDGNIFDNADLLEVK